MVKTHDSFWFQGFTGEHRVLYPVIKEWGYMKQCVFSMKCNKQNLHEMLKKLQHLTKKDLSEFLNLGLLVFCSH